MITKTGGSEHYTIKILILYTILATISALFIYMTQHERLVLYDQYYLCLYQDWNPERCTLAVYGEKIK